MEQKTIDYWCDGTKRSTHNNLIENIQKSEKLERDVAAQIAPETRQLIKENITFFLKKTKNKLNIDIFKHN